MRHLPLLLAIAAVAHAQDLAQRATVRLQVSDRALARAYELYRQKAPQSVIRQYRVHQPYTLELAGTIISAEGEIVTTALHPLADLRVLVTMFDGTEHEAELVGTDPRSSLALVRVPVKTKDHLTLDANAVEARAHVALMNHDKEAPELIAGMVARPNMPVAIRDLYGVNRGQPIKLGSGFLCASPAGRTDPGSACVSAKGGLCGIVIGTMPQRPRTSYQFTFALPASRVLRIVKDLREHGRVIRSYYGVTLLPVEPAVRKHFDVPDSASAVIRVETPSPAASAGLRRHDIVLAVDGKSYASTYELGDAMADKKPGSEVRLSVLRGGKKLELRAVPVERDS